MDNDSFYSAYREARRARLYRKKFDESKVNRSSDGTFASKASGAVKRAALDLSIQAAEHLPKILQGMMGPVMASSVERAIESDSPPAKVRVKKSDYEQAKPMSLKHGYKTPGHFIGAVARLKGAGEEFEYHGSVPARTENESDKSYAKRAVKDLPQPKSLPETPAHYFNVDKSDKSVSLSSLKPTRARKSGIANAARFMRMALEGLSAKRDPISVSDNGDGTFEILDGNSTYAAMKKYGWNKAPVKVVNRQSAEQARRIGEKWDYSRKRPWDESKVKRGQPDNPGQFATKSGASAGTPRRVEGEGPGESLKAIRKYKFLPPSLAQSQKIAQTIVDQLLKKKFPQESGTADAIKPLADKFNKPEKAKQDDKWVYKGECCELDEAGKPKKNPDGTPVVTEEFLRHGERMRTEASYVQNFFLEAMSGSVRKAISGDTKPANAHYFNSGDAFEKGKEVVKKHPDRPHVMVGGVKGIKRASEKAAARGLNDERPNLSSITDLVRGTITAPSVNDLYVAVTRAEKALEAHGFEVAAYQDRFNDPLPTGYRDIQMICRHKETGHMCELQATTSLMWLAKEAEPTSKGEGAHKLYENTRKIEESVTKEHRDYDTAEANDMVGLVQEQVSVYGKGWEESQRADTVYGASGGQDQDKYAGAFTAGQVRGGSGMGVGDLRSGYPPYPEHRPPTDVSQPTPPRG